ncbi:hydrogenase large subunit [Catenulispora rubra]|uniref:hydrogenase large subunit n=1 Tax=Catenulispora rubra TaxID=280293 RepID=UPI0018927125|nr:NADH-quinone oxidoreductase subunit C [Catenulispora rubra]
MKIIDVGPGDLLPVARGLLNADHRLALVAAHHDLGGTAGRDAMRVVYLFLGPGDSRFELRLRLEGPRPQVPSLASVSFPAGRFEREMHDLFGIRSLGHPLPRRLVRHFGWPTGWHPMRRDAGPAPEFGETLGLYPFLEVQGPGVYEIPVGPVHAGLIEPGHFRFSVVGETILKLKARLWFVHKGIEKLFEGNQPENKLTLAEKISGDTAVGHGLAYARAVEDALGIDIPPEAHTVRAILLELERLYNHIGDIGALCNDVGHGILNQHAGRVREQLLRINAEVTGHRLLRGGVVIGGAQVRSLPDPDRLATLAADVAETVELALGHTVVRDRFTGTAVLTREQARDLGTLGYVARASGLDTDARRDHPGGDPTPPPPAVSAETGDVMARFAVRAEEYQRSTDHIKTLTGQLGKAGRHVAAGPADLGSGHGVRSGVGIAEGWRGTIVHRAELTPAGTLDRVKIVDPSFFNWPALPVALRGAIVPDFPLVNKSFNQSYAGNDL